ncbi:hypothetical protein D3C80_963480 [compost metagenome]
MGNATGQLANGFHFLCLAHGFFVTPYLRRTLLDLLLQGFVQAPQLLLGALAFAAIAGQGAFQHAQLFQAITQLVLATAAAQGHADLADQGGGLERAFEDGHIATELAQRAGIAVAGVEGNEDGQVGPGRLVAQILAQRGQVEAMQRFTGNDRQPGALLERGTQAVEVGTDKRAKARLVEQGARVGAVIAHQHRALTAHLCSIHASPSLNGRP